ncbi:hypothetical protein [Urbifossiella limnaea]|uniref:Uncharacterized protein n=1 Tax=Urbifossiella limnaea TaxID=2528023 RepID=A0A517XXK5_9BACT|nr:hypothetical protein [Urbifossiella limnaea]QDU22242.1 hypothetical protein ETAA1_42190 [Urbifossiella limnaea]
MIRFRCTSCDREYHLPDALARMPLLCKGCGTRLDVPEPTPEPTPEPPPAHSFPDPTGTVDLFPESDDVRTRGPVAKDVPDPADSVDLFPRAYSEPPPIEMPTPAAPARRGLRVVVDGAVGVLLAVVGALLGGLATQKGTVEVLREAGGAAKFPTTDLLVWLGCVAAPVMGYVLFVNRGRSIGVWVSSRMASRGRKTPG